MTTKKVIVGYYITWKQYHSERSPKMVSVQGGIEVIAQWREGSKTIMLRDGCYSTSEIASVEPRYAFSDREAHEKLASGEAITEQAALESIQARLLDQTAGGLPALPEGGQE